MTMNERFAAEPSAFSSAKDIKYLFEKCGFEHGRFISQYPQKWLKTLRRIVYSLPEVEQLRAKRIIERLAGSVLLPCNASYDSSRDWCDNALAQAANGQFKKVIGTRPPDTLTLDELDDEVLGDSRGERIKQLVEEYVRIAGPLLDASPEVFLIDPYFRLGRPAKAKVLNAFVNRVALRPIGFTVFTRSEEFSKDSGNREAQRQIEKLESSLGSGQSVKFVAVFDNSRNEMHARYLLSLRGAIKFDKGFEVEELEDRTVDVEAVGRSLHDELVRLYISGEHGFTVDDAAGYEIHHD